MEKSTRRVGTVSRGIRCPIIRQGDDLASIVTDSVLLAAKEEGFVLHDRDVVSITESIVARAQGNYASVQDIAADVRVKCGGGTVGVIFPILSRNRFAICLKGIAMGAKKIVLMLSYPSDEVGNELVSLDKVDEAGVNPYSDVLTLDQYRNLFGENRHEFTGVDYVAYYTEIIEGAGAEAEIIFANQPKAVLDYTDTVITCDIHTRARTKRILKAAGAKIFAARNQQMIWGNIEGGKMRYARATAEERPESISKSWSTVTELSRIPKERSGSWPTRSFLPLIPPASSAHPTS